MGEAKRRSQLDPTWGKGKMETIAAQLGESLRTWQETQGRGFFYTSESEEPGWMTYVTHENFTEKGLWKDVREIDRIIADQLVGRMTDYDPSTAGLHLHMNADPNDRPLEFKEFPLRLINPDGAFDERSLGIVKVMLEIGGARIKEV